ncbi:MAG: VCBS repeat-containing protein [Balneolaceae bacterium]|nr:VCBS repeat-containing protein [Balneolaceae bacterium]
MLTSGSKVEAIELDGDGDTDLFVGGRVLSGRYPLAPRSYLLQNDGGRFTDVTEQFAPELMNPGMVTDAVWADLNNNGRPELVVAGEWMPIRVFEQNADQTFTEQTKAAELTATSGWWNVLKVADLNSDGFLDIIAGNHGLNTLLNASAISSLLTYPQTNLCKSSK